ncbi:hypothetical protein CBS101457_002137 [Exobasidium rhododendri]|nr:hypothetical protein CBS101457_002137 [Exobasidium rhododendri]
MSSKRAQIRLLYQSIPARYLTGTTIDSLSSRCQAYLSAVDVWASKGNGKAIQKAGSGLIAVCAWKAAKALSEDAQMEPFQKVSGLSPQQFMASDRDFTEAIETASATRNAITLPSTPHRDAAFRKPVDAAFSEASSSSASQDLSPEARLKRTRDIMSGAAFAKTNSSPLSRSTTYSRDYIDDASEPHTPTKRALRDRTTIKERQIFDPSIYDQTPTKKVLSPHRPDVNLTLSRSGNALLPHTSGGSTALRLSKNRHVDAMDSIGAESATSPLKRRLVRERRTKIITGYPAGEPFRVGRSEVIGEWTSRNSKDRVQRCIVALQHCQDQQGWQEGEVVGQLHLPLR